jgi:hypothetical protein
MLASRWGRAPRSRPAGMAPNHRELRRSRAGRGERARKRRRERCQVRTEKAKWINHQRGVESQRRRQNRGQFGSYGKSLEETCLPSRRRPAIEVARARSRLLVGTREPVVPMWRSAGRRAPGWTQKEEPQAAGTASGRVPMRGTGTERLVVVMKPGNAGGAKEACYLGRQSGQPPCGRSR